MTFFAIPVRDQAQYEPRLLELENSPRGFEISFPGDDPDHVCSDPAERVNSFDSSWEAQAAADFARQLTASIVKKIGG